MQDPKCFLSLNGHDGNQETKKISPRSSPLEESENEDLGLSLRIQSNTTTSQHVRDHQEENHESTTRFMPMQQSNLINPGNFSGDIKANNIANNPIASLPNRKARVSVRARCEAATVSFSHMFLDIIKFLLYSSLYVVCNQVYKWIFKYYISYSLQFK